MLTRNGILGVSSFFVVSGFVITRTMLRRDPDLRRIDLRGFYTRRAARILPLLLGTILAGAIAYAFAGPVPSELAATAYRQPDARFDPMFWGSLLTFSFNWLRIARGQGWGMHWDVLWSLAVEEQFYLFYPLLLRLLGRRRFAIPVLLLLGASGPVARIAAGPNWLPSFTNTVAAFDLLACGALLHFALERWPVAPQGRIARIALVVSTILSALTAIFIYLVSSDWTWPVTILGISVAVFLFGAIRLGSKRGRRRHFGARITEMGQYSYSGYLLHVTVLFLLAPVLTRLAPLSGLAVACGVTLLAAALVYHFFEVPAGRAVRKALEPRPRAG
jgi:peptidoglycan/LPS O-acetylase OafA/YrhL